MCHEIIYITLTLYALLYIYLNYIYNDETRHNMYGFDIQATELYI